MFPICVNVTLMFVCVCVQIDEVLRDEERAEALSGHVDKLLLMLSMQFRMAHSKHMSDPEVSRDDVIRLYRCLLSTLLQVCPPCVSVWIRVGGWGRALQYLADNNNNNNVDLYSAFQRTRRFTKIIN